MSAPATLVRADKARKTTPVGTKASAKTNTGTSTAKARATAPAEASKGQRVVSIEMDATMLAFTSDAVDSLVSSWRVVKGSKFEAGLVKPTRTKKEGVYVYSIKGGTGKGIGGGKAAKQYSWLIFEQGYTQAEAIAEVQKLFTSMLALQYRLRDEEKTLAFESTTGKTTKATKVVK